MNEVTVKVEWLMSPVDVQGYYEPPEKGSWQDGLQMEPDYAANFEVEAVLLDGQDIAPYLNKAALEELSEEVCLKMEG